MKSGRFFLHPILSNISVFGLFLLYLGISSLIGYFFFNEIDRLVKVGRIPIEDLKTHSDRLVIFLLSPLFRTALVGALAIIGTALTSFLTLGPIKRVELWLKIFEKDVFTTPLRIRHNDHLRYFSSLLNETQRRLQAHQNRKRHFS